MKKIVIAIFALAGAVLYGKTEIVVSIPPQEYFVKAISGDSDVTVMVKPGNSPHTYEPKPSQMKAVGKAGLYLSIGVEFESAWLPRFAAQNPKMKIVDISEGIERIPMTGSGKKQKKGTRTDPHIWTSPSNVRILARNIADALASLHPEKKPEYEKNLKRFLETIDKLDTQIRKKLSKLPKNSTFMVFHPAWGYFAKEYGLRQLPVQIEGKSPKPAQLAALIEYARKEKVRALFVQPEFPDKSARLLAAQLGIPVVKISPLNHDWYSTMLDLAGKIAEEDR